MSLGKYSPTVSMWYAQDQQWYEKNGGSCIVIDAAGNVVDYRLYDKDGYDSYGYHKDTELDRAGYSESEYLSDMLDYWDLTESEGAPLYEEVSRVYSGIPAPVCSDVKMVGNEWTYLHNHTTEIK